MYANRSETVVGLSNLDGDPIDGTWPVAVAAISTAYPGLPLVGYERAVDLPPARKAGFTPIGPLRVWHKP